MQDRIEEESIERNSFRYSSATVMNLPGNPACSTTALTAVAADQAVESKNMTGNPVQRMVEPAGVAGGGECGAWAHGGFGCAVL